MKALLDKLTDRALTLIGLDFDIPVQLRGEHLSQITDALYLGARPGPEHVQALKDAGVTHVVSSLSEGERAKMAFLSRDFQTLFLPAQDSIHQDLAAHFPTLWDFASSAQRAQPDAKLLVHCQVGVSRSATLVIALLMQRHHTRFFETFCDVRAKRVHILPNVGFAAQLQRLERQHHPQPIGDDGLSSLARYLHRVCNVPVEADVVQDMLERHDYDALAAIRATFGEDVPRVIQGMRA